MSLIKFPTQITPARVTVRLQRTDEIHASPITGIQQVAARGNPFWRWTYEYTDLSDDEREVVQAFLLKCKGAVNTFKVHDPGTYDIRGSMSDWIDVFSGYGSFNITAGSETNKVNSWFGRNGNLVSHITDEQMVRFEWRDYVAAQNLAWQGHDLGYADVGSLELAKPYVQRIKTFLGHGPKSFSFAVGSGGSAYYGQSTNQVKSSDMLTAPFIPVSTQHTIRCVDWTGSGGRIGDYHEHADYQLMRAALMVNTENLFTRSNDFGHGDWSTSNAGVASGYGDGDPVSAVASGAWKLFAANTNNVTKYLTQNITKTNTPDWYEADIYAKPIELSELAIELDNGAGLDAKATFWLNSGTYDNLTLGGTTTKANAEIFDVGSGYYRCKLALQVNSAAAVHAFFYISSGAAQTWIASSGDGIEIFGANMRKHPCVGPYTPTVADAISSDTAQTGSRIYVTGLDPQDKIKAGQRFEIVNQFHNLSSNLYERSELKRITKEIVAHREGWAELEFDPPIRNAPVKDYSWIQQDHEGETLHNPVVFHRPEMKARLVNGTIQYIDKPLKLTDIVFDVIEDLTE
jgi:hypothetical protein